MANLISQLTNITEMMQGEGPTVKCALAAADGAVSEVSIDMTPKKQAVNETLGGEVTFLGQWEPLGVFLLVRREDAGLPRFAGALPKPFDAATGEFGGACLMTRTDEAGEPRDFPLAEYEAFAARAPEPWQELAEESDAEEAAAAANPLEALLEGSDEDDDSEGDDDDASSDEDDPYDSEDAEEDEAAAAEDDEDDGELRAMLLESVRAKFEEEHGRAPSDAEAEALAAAVDAKIHGSLGAEAAGEAIIIEKIVARFTEQHGRAPESDEIDAILEKLREADAAREAAEAAEAEAEAEEDGGDIFDQLVALFKEQNGRDPTEAEMQQWRDTLAEANAEGALNGEQADAAAVVDDALAGAAAAADAAAAEPAKKKAKREDTPSKPLDVKN